MPKQSITANQFLARLGAPVTNLGTSWDGYDVARNIIVMKLWKGEREHSEDGLVRVLFWTATRPSEKEKSKVGRNERRRSIAAIHAGLPVYALMRDGGGAVRPGGHYYDDDYLYEIDSIEERPGGSLCAIAQRKVTISEFLNGPLGIQADLDEIERCYSSTPTVRRAMIDARLGQGRYRAQLLELWGGRCAVTGSRVLEVLRASHAKPWKSCNDQERLDPNNGLPLVATLDALFDAGLIGFDAKLGNMVVSPLLPADAYAQLGVPTPLVKPPTIAQSSYLSAHMTLAFKHK